MRTRAQKEKLAEEGVPPTPPQQLADTGRPRRARNTHTESAEPATKLTRDARVSKKTASHAAKAKPERKPKVAPPTITPSEDDPTSTHSETTSQNDVEESEASKDAEGRTELIEETLEVAVTIPRTSENPQISRSPVQAHPVQAPPGVPHAQQTGESTLKRLEDFLVEESSRLEVQNGSSPLSSVPSIIVTPEVTPGLGKPQFSSTPSFRSQSQSQSTTSSARSRSRSQTSLLFREITGTTPSRPSIFRTPYTSLRVVSGDEPSPAPPGRNKGQHSPHSPLLTGSEYGDAQRSLAQRLGICSPGDAPLHPPSVQNTPAQRSEISTSGDTPLHPPSVEYAPALRDEAPTAHSAPLDFSSQLPSPTAAGQMQLKRENELLRAAYSRDPLPTQFLRFSLESIIDVEAPASVAHDLLAFLERHPEMQWAPSDRVDQITKALWRARRLGLTSWQMAGKMSKQDTITDEYFKKHIVFTRDPEPPIDDIPISSQALRKKQKASQTLPQPTRTLPQSLTTLKQSSTALSQSSPTPLKSSHTQQKSSSTLPQAASQEDGSRSETETPPRAVGEKPGPTGSRRRGRPRRDEQRQPNNEQGRDRHMSRISKTTKPQRITRKEPQKTHKMLDKFIQIQTIKNLKAEEEERRRALCEDEDDENMVSSSSDEDTEMDTQLGPSEPIDLAGVRQSDNAVTDMNMTEDPGEEPQVPQTPSGRSWGLSLVPSVARTVSKLIPGFGRPTHSTPHPLPPPQQRPAATEPRPRQHVSATQGRDTSLRETSGNATLLTKEAREERRAMKKKKKEMKEDAEKKAMQEEIERLRKEKENLEKENKAQWTKGRDFAVAINGYQDNPWNLRRRRERLALIPTHAETEAARIQADEVTQALQGHPVSQQSAQATKKSKRKRSPSPEVIPNRPGCSYGMNEDFFIVDSSSEDGDDSHGAPSSKRSRTSGEFTGRTSSPRQPVVGDPLQATPYTGTVFKIPEQYPETPTRVEADNLFSVKASAHKDSNGDETPRPLYNSFKVPSPTYSDDVTFEDESHHEPSTPSPAKLGKRPETSTPPSRLAPKESTTPQSSPPKQSMAPPSTFPKPSVPPKLPSLPEATPSASEISLARQREAALKYAAKTPSRLQQSSRLSSSTVASPNYQYPSPPQPEPVPTPAYLLPPRVPTADDPITERDFTAYDDHAAIMKSHPREFVERNVVIGHTDVFAHRQFDTEFADFNATIDMEEAGLVLELPAASERVEAFLEDTIGEEEKEKAVELFETEFALMGEVA